MKTLKVIISVSSLLLLILSTINGDSQPKDAIAANQSLKDGQTLVSPSQSFELGFFSPGTSKNRYLGIWYKKIGYGTVVWVANRETPISDSSGALELNNNGTLVLVNITNDLVWSANASRIPSNRAVATLLDSGNLVVRDGDDDSSSDFLWQSFDYIGDTLLPEMKFGRDLVTGFDRSMLSWKSADDPARGDYVFQIDPTGFPQLILRKGSTIQFRAGSWNGVRWTGAGAMIKNAIYTYEFVANEKEVYYKYTLLNTSVLSRMVLNASGASERFTWIDRTQSWLRYYSVIQDQCDNYAVCGANSLCDISKSPVCVCLDSFVPKSPRYWGFQDWSDGCVRKTHLSCDDEGEGDGEGFLKITGVKLPDTSHSRVNKSIGLEECNRVCLRNCSCMAYANSDIRGSGSGCLLWFTDLLDIRTFPVGGQDLYVRLSASDLAHIKTKTKSKGKKLIAVMISSVVSFLGLLAIGCILYKERKKLISKGKRKGGVRKETEEDSMREDTDLPVYDLKTIVTATDSFSFNKKLGEGGFGAVYKGMLIDGQEIAVKRLSKSSGQGLKEFMNEVVLIAKLQHRNLVKLLGCCIHGDERMLIYEYMPNQSLDYFIFDPIKGKLLDQHKRTNIIGGIARGLLYLHQDSRLRIIHRDLKASNVLLDKDMIPKISDFGLARSFGGDEISGETNKVVGTYGYMSPEYAVDGLFSVKSDVYSFGVLVLEIVSGKKNRGFHHPDHNHNLLGHAWKLWKQGRAIELIGKWLDDSCDLSEILRCIQVGLLCVQQKPEDRPNMSTVVLMLGCEGTLPEPMQPGFFTERNFPESESSTSKHESCSTNEITVTWVEPR